MSDLIGWFKKRREAKAVTTVQRHLALTTGIVEDLEGAVAAAVAGDETELSKRVERVTSGAREKLTHCAGM